MEELFTGFFSKEPKTCQKGQNGIVQFRHVHNKKTTSHMVGDVSNSISASSLSHIQHSIVISILSSSAALEFTFVRVKKGRHIILVSTFFSGNCRIFLELLDVLKKG